MSRIDQPNNQTLLKGAAITGVINAIVNGAIQYFLLKKHAPIPITVDSITNNVHTVLGAAVPLAICLAMIITVVSYYKIKGPKIGFFPAIFWMVIKHGFFTFGVVTALAVVWQRSVGTIEVGLLPAVIIIGIIAGLISGVIEYSTIKGGAAGALSETVPQSL